MTLGARRRCTTLKSKTGSVSNVDPISSRVSFILSLEVTSSTYTQIRLVFVCRRVYVLRNSIQLEREREKKKTRANRSVGGAPFYFTQQPVSTPQLLTSLNFSVDLRLLFVVGLAFAWIERRAGHHAHHERSQKLRVVSQGSERLLDEVFHSTRVGVGHLKEPLMGEGLLKQVRFILEGLKLSYFQIVQVGHLEGRSRQCRRLRRSLWTYPADSVGSGDWNLWNGLRRRHFSEWHFGVLRVADSIADSLKLLLLTCLLQHQFDSEKNAYRSACHFDFIRCDLSQRALASLSSDYTPVRSFVVHASSADRLNVVVDDCPRPAWQITQVALLTWHLLCRVVVWLESRRRRYE